MGLYNQPGTTLAISTTEPSADPEGQLWYDATNDLLKASNGSAFLQVGKTSFAGAAVVSHSTTIGDYTTPSSATSSSTKAQTLVQLSVFGTSSDQSIDNFTTYATQGAADALWISANTAKSRVNITNDNIDFDFEDNSGSSSHIYKDIGYALNDTLARVRFKIRFTSSDINSRTWFGLSSNTSDQGTAKDFLGVLFHDTAGSAPSFKTADADGAALPTAGDSASAAPLAMATDYWVDINRTSATVYTVSVYSDAYTTLIETITGSCAATVASLRYIGFYNRNDFDSTNKQVGTIDDVEVFDGPVYTAAMVYDTSTSTTAITQSENNPNIYVDMGSALNLCAIAMHWSATSTETEIKIQSSSDANSWTDKRKITVSNLTAAAWNYYRFNIAGGARYIRVYGTGTSKVLAINEIKVLKKTDAEIFADLGIVEISASDTSLDGDGI